MSRFPPPSRDPAGLYAPPNAELVVMAQPPRRMLTVDLRTDRENGRLLTILETTRHQRRSEHGEQKMFRLRLRTLSEQIFHL